MGKRKTMSIATDIMTELDRADAGLLDAHEELARRAVDVADVAVLAGGHDRVYTFADGSRVALGTHTSYAGNAREYPVRSDLTGIGRALLGC